MSRAIEWIARDRRRAIGLGLLIVGLALLAFKAWQVVSTVRSLSSRLAQAQAMAQSANRNLDLDRVDSLLMGARADVQSLRSEAGPFLSLAPYLGWLPGVGGDLQAAPALLDMAEGLTEAGVIVWDQVSPLVGWWSAPDRARGVDLQYVTLAQLAAAKPQLEQARAALNRASDARARLRVERLSPRLAGQIRRLDDLLPLAQLGAEALLGAPEVLGLNGPRTYLVLAQNEDEIRPTGGFISGAGRATFERGRLVEFSFMDANLVDDLTRPYPDLPAPLARYMGLGEMTELWLFRDSNWSPDFPTSARQAAEFYNYGQRVPVYGVVAIDQRAVQMLISAMGPVNVVMSNTQVTVTGENIVSIMREAWNPPGGQVTREWVLSRKGFMGQLAASVKARIEHDPGSVPWMAVGRAALQALDERHILVYVSQAELAEALARQGWDGAIRQTEGDYVMVVDANVGYGKANIAITQRASYTITLNRDGSGQAVLSLDYDHSGKPGESCQQELRYDSQITYQSMANRCFYDYLRVYAPRGARLLDSTRQTIPSSYFLSRQPVNSQAEMSEPEAGRSVFAFLFVVETGKNWQARLTYELPSTITRQMGGEKRYALWIQKQPGKGTIPTTVTVDLPPDTQVISTVPSAREVLAQEGRIRFELLVNKDTYVEVQYRN